MTECPVLKSFNACMIDFGTVVLIHAGDTLQIPMLTADDSNCEGYGLNTYGNHDVMPKSL